MGEKNSAFNDFVCAQSAFSKSFSKHSRDEMLFSVLIPGLPSIWEMIRVVQLEYVN